MMVCRNAFVVFDLLLLVSLQAAEVTSFVVQPHHHHHHHPSSSRGTLTKTTNQRRNYVYDQTTRRTPPPPNTCAPLYAKQNPRRDFLLRDIVAKPAVTGLLAWASGQNKAVAAAAANVASNSGLVADLPMIRLKLPQQAGIGRDYIAVPLKIQGKGPFEFMVDTGLTTEFITPHLYQTLGMGQGFGGGAAAAAKPSRIQGLAAGGTTVEHEMVELNGATLCCGSSGEVALPTLHAVITDFPQEHIDPAHDPIEGMLGMELLSLFDVEFDFTNQRVRFFTPTSAAKAAAGKEASNQQQQWVEIPAVVINETGLIGIRLVAAGKQQQPVLAFLDCGSTFSAINWKAAELLGLPNKNDPLYQTAPQLVAVGIDGRPLQLPIVKQQLSFVGDALQKDGKLIGFAPPPPDWKPWDTVPLAIGDLPAFQSILGDGTRPYTGPAALIGLDILSQRRLIFETSPEGSNTRKRRILVSPQ